MPAGIYVRTKEHGLKISLALRGHKTSPETKEKIRRANLGKIISEKARQKISLSQKGRTPWNKGKTMWRSNNHPRGMLGKIPSKEHRDKIRVALTGFRRSEQVCQRIGLAKTGSNNPMWRGGITSFRLKVWRSGPYKEWRDNVFKRDNYICQKCGEASRILNAHHIKSFVEHPKLRFNIDNGQTLCVYCHRKTDNYGRTLKGILT